jgi:formamidopyrimidine-DNA glycosylase
MKTFLACKARKVFSNPLLKVKGVEPQVPELPEVETVKETLKQLVIGKKIEDVVIHWPKLIKHPDDQAEFQTLLKGETIRDITRRGKFLCFYLDEVVLISHLRMEGRYSFSPDPLTEPIDAHTHVVFLFTDGSELRYRDVRKFGTMHVYKKGEEFTVPPLLHLGPEPLGEAFDLDILQKKLSQTSRTIKSVLLDQTVVVGLGNIYVDEALFRAGIHPETIAKTLSRKKMARLVTAIKETLSEAVSMGGSTVRTYLNGQGRMGMFQQRLFVYGREGEPCKTCGRPITKIKLGGRGTHFCSKCQRRKPL